MTCQTAINVAAIAVALVLVAGCTRITRPIYGVQEGQLANCQGIPGCVSSQATQPEHHIEPIQFTSLRNDARIDLFAALRTFEEARVVSSHRSYLRSEFFVDTIVDDVEFYLPLDERVIHVRSATREDMGDSGVNRARIEELRERFGELQKRR